MKLPAFFLALALSSAVTPSCFGIKIPFRQAKRSNVQRRSGSSTFTSSRPKVLAAATDNTNGFDISSFHDLIYLANVTLGGNSYPVQLDTGSSDLWIKGATTPLPNANETAITYNLTYGIGWAFGHISYAPVEFAGMSITSQAFMDISSAQNPALSYGAEGILGLGFTSLSTIDALVNRTNSSAGRSLLFNLFADNPSEPNFIAFSLERTSDTTDEVDGSFSIGEYDPKYASVANSTAIPTFPVNSPTRWTVLVDYLLVGETQVPLTTSVANAPGNKAVALLDSGTSFSYAPVEVCQAIYGGIKGAEYSATLGQWIVPCGAEVDVALQIGGQVFPVHPLDVSPASTTESTTCVGSFIPQDISVGDGSFDWLVGDNFLRSVYSIYDFGDFDDSGNMGNPYMKLLSLVDPDEASADFHAVRGGTAATNITYNAASSTSDSTNVSLSDDVAQVLDKIGKFFPAMLAVMAFNALILLALVVVGVVFLCKRRGSKSSRKARRTTSPVPLNRFSSGGASAHNYEPVSMAMTDDTFVAPSPAFRGDSIKNRPKSNYSTLTSTNPNSPPPEDQPFTPPGISAPPVFTSNVQPGDRPQSTFMPAPSRPRSFLPPASRPQSSYVPGPPGESPPRSPFAASPNAFANETVTEGRQSTPSPVPSIRTDAPPGDSLFVPPAPVFRTNVQPGDRPRSYAPAGGSPEDEVFAPPAAAFRGTNANRPNSSYVPGSGGPIPSPQRTGSGDSEIFTRPNVALRGTHASRPNSSYVPGSGGPSPTQRSPRSPFSVAPTAVAEGGMSSERRPIIPSRSPARSIPAVPEQSLTPPVPAFRSNIQPGDRPRSYAPSGGPTDEELAPPAPAFSGSDRPKSFA